VTGVIAVDLGKTGCRVGLWRDGRQVSAVDGPGAPGLGEPGGAAAAAATIAALVERLPDLAVSTADVVCVGAAGMTAAIDAGAQLADLLVGSLPVRSTAIVSDALTAHAGALGGAAGVVLSAGTGVVAVGVSSGGECRLVDGWGLWLGDEGGGAWVGRAGLRAVVRARDGRGPATALTSCAQDRFGDLGRLPATITADGNPARAMAGFGPDVARCAEAGDPVAAAVVADAAAALAETTVAAVRATQGEAAVPVAFVGGLSKWGPVLLQPWRTTLAAAAQRSGTLVEIREPVGTSLDGAAMLGAGIDLPHQAHVVRAHRPTGRIDDLP